VLAAGDWTAGVVIVGAFIFWCVVIVIAIWLERRL